MSFERNIGFIGAGGIACAMARGLCSSPDFGGRIFMSVHKNRTRADELARLFPDKVTVCGDNQQVLDSAEIIFPTVLPKQLEEVATALKFSPSHRIVHIAAGTKIEKAAPWYAEAGNIVRAVPLPFSARREGPVVMCGDDELCEQALSLFGSLVKVKSERELEILAVVTCVMVPYYALVGEIVGWCGTKGLDFRSGLDYTCFMNEALTSLMRRECTEDVEAFLRENTTPGGLNEMTLRMIRERGACEAWREALEAAGKRYDL